MTNAARNAVAARLGAARLAEELEQCTAQVRWIVDSEPLIVSEQARAMARRGKRLRPLLALAAAYSASATPDETVRRRAVSSGVVVELLHLASLVHDDIMDEAQTRHGMPTANSREGNTRALLAGDYLLAQALATACALGRAEGSIASRTFVRLCEGQALEAASLFDLGRSREQYFACLAGKTGSLFEASCRLGAMAGGLSPRSVAALAEYGMRLGVAYQLLDDVSDFTASEAELGKPVGHDLAAGVYTLPLLLALDGHARPAVQPRGGDRAAAASAAAEAARVVRVSGAIEETLDEAELWAARAIDALAPARAELDTAAFAMLADLAEAIVPAPAGAGLRSAA